MAYNKFNIVGNRMTNPYTKKSKKLNQTSSTELRNFQHVRKFKDFPALVNYAKKMVYLVVRLREVDGRVYRQNLGTAFLAGKQRMMTSAHCINSDRLEDKGVSMAFHEAGDQYLFLNKDEKGECHFVVLPFKVDADLFLYKDMDMAVFHLPDLFYKRDDSGAYFQHPEAYLELSAKPAALGADAGIIGYPFSFLNFTKDGKLDISEVCIRVDKGVVNTHRKVSDALHLCEFTTSFNPGNSGGPILDVKTGAVIGIVRGYRDIPLKWVEDTIPINAIGNEKEMPHMYQLRTTYSVGISSTTLLSVNKKHALGKI